MCDPVRVPCVRVFSARQSRDLETDQCKQKEKDDLRAWNKGEQTPFKHQGAQSPHPRFSKRAWRVMLHVPRAAAAIVDSRYCSQI